MYTNPAEARIAAHAYASGRQDQKIRDVRDAPDLSPDRGSKDANVRRAAALAAIRNSDLPVRFARMFAAAFSAYETGRAVYCPDLEPAHDNVMRHGHPYRRGECADCGRGIGTAPPATDRNVEALPNDPLLDLIRSTPDRCDQCRASSTASAARAG